MYQQPFKNIFTVFDFCCDDIQGGILLYIEHKGMCSIACESIIPPGI